MDPTQHKAGLYGRRWSSAGPIQIKHTSFCNYCVAHVVRIAFLIVLYVSTITPPAITVTVEAKNVTSVYRLVERQNNGRDYWSEEPAARTVFRCIYICSDTEASITCLGGINRT